MSTAPAEVEQEIGRLLVRFLDASKQHVMQALAELGLTLAQGMALHYLDHPRRMRELADDLGYDASHITGIVDKLEAAGIVERRPDPHDRRVKLLMITDKGRELRLTVERRAFAGQPMLARLAPAEREQLRDLLRAAVGEAAPSP